MERGGREGIEIRRERRGKEETGSGENEGGKL